MAVQPTFVSIDGVMMPGYRNGVGWSVEAGGLEGWFDGALMQPQGRVNRPWAQGVFGSRVYGRGRLVTLSAVSLAGDEMVAGARRREAAALGAHGDQMVLQVGEADGTVTEAAVRIESQPLVQWRPGWDYVRAQWQFFADDPLRYGAEQIVSTGFAIDLSGLEFDLFTDGTTDTGYLEFGDPGAETGTVTLLNSGTAPAPWTATVDGPVGDAGFELVSAGRTVRFSRGVPSGSVLSLDSATARATLDGSDVTRYLTLKEFVPVPAGGSLDMLFRPVEGASSAVLTVTTRPASW